MRTWPRTARPSRRRCGGAVCTQSFTMTVDQEAVFELDEQTVVRPPGGSQLAAQTRPHQTSPTRLPAAEAARGVAVRRGRSATRFSETAPRSSKCLARLTITATDTTRTPRHSLLSNEPLGPPSQANDTVTHRARGMAQLVIDRVLPRRRSGQGSPKEPRPPPAAVATPICARRRRPQLDRDDLGLRRRVADDSSWLSRWSPPPVARRRGGG